MKSTEQFCASLFRDVRAEFRLLVDCCRWPVDLTREPITQLLAKLPIDWNKFLKLAERHRVSGFAANALVPRDDIPHEVRAVLRGRAEKIERDNLLSVAVASSAVRVLKSGGIAVLVLKGVPLSATIFQSISIRHSKDIDLLVDREHFQRAASMLSSNGFRVAATITRELTPKQSRDFERYRKHYSFVHVPSGCHLELHWRPYDNQKMGTLPATASEQVDCSPSMALPTVPKEEIFPLLCAHGAGHAWFRLKWLVDVAALLGKSSPSEQDRLLHAARERGLQRPAEQAMLLCAGLFGAAQIPLSARSTKTGRWLAKIARDALLEPIKTKDAGTEFVPKRLLLSRMFLKRGWKYRVEEARLNIASPADWQKLKLPPWLHFAYPLARVPLWLRRRWARKRARRGA